MHTDDRTPDELERMAEFYRDKGQALLAAIFQDRANAGRALEQRRADAAVWNAAEGQQ